MGRLRRMAGAGYARHWCPTAARDGNISEPVLRQADCQGSSALSRYRLRKLRRRAAGRTHSRFPHNRDTATPGRQRSHSASTAATTGFDRHVLDSCSQSRRAKPTSEKPDGIPLPGGHARILWTLSVTTAETEFRRQHGHEALEQLFDEAEITPPILSGRRSPEFPSSGGTVCGLRGGIGSRFRHPR
jgi:hypothetical protein